MARTHYDWIALKQEYILGDDSSVSAFVKRKGITTPTKYYAGWSKEKEEYKKKIFEDSMKEISKQEVDDITQVRERQARIAKFLQLKGADKLKNMDELTVDDARKLVVSGLQEERKALGMEGSGSNGNGGNSFTQINIGPKLNIDRLVEGLDYEGVLKLIAELKRERTKRSLQPLNANGSGKVQDGEVV